MGAREASNRFDASRLLLAILGVILALTAGYLIRRSRGAEPGEGAFCAAAALAS